MAKKQKYTVVREHGGFAEGDERVAHAADVQHLVPHCLELIGEADEDAEESAGEKSEDEPQNKAEPAPANKADTPKARKAAKGA